MNEEDVLSERPRYCVVSRSDSTTNWCRLFTGYTSQFRHPFLSYHGNVNVTALAKSIIRKEVAEMEMLKAREDVKIQVERRKLEREDELMEIINASVLRVKTKDTKPYIKLRSSRSVHWDQQVVSELVVKL
ncbi:hypothetical protein Tco_0680163 [Tanacetum coccineum]|uniref:Uncharacterized protein n=1 Tax=Tanacetum coccineum TaxID=301880 RepID=A0ABQ4XJS4_9ASTR